MRHAQAAANQIRDALADNDIIRRLGIEVLWAMATAQALTLRARYRDRVITLERAGKGWERTSPDGLVAELAQELVAEAFSARHPTIATIRWRPLVTGAAVGRPART